MKQIFLIFCFIFSFGASATVKDYVLLAHKQYLMTNFKSEDSVLKLLLQIKDGLKQAQNQKPEDSSARSNLLALYNRAVAQAHEERMPKGLMSEACGKTTLKSIFSKLKDHQDKHGKVVPLGWSLPKEFQVLVTGVNRKFEPANGKIIYSLGFFGWLQEPGSVPEQIQVIRFPDTIVIDKKSGIGNFGDGRRWQTPMTAITFDSEADVNPPKEGLYLLNIAMKGSSEMKGWFVVGGDLALDESPRINVPFIGQEFQNKNPILKWTNYTSTYFRNIEHRKRRLIVSEVRPDEKVRVWERTEVCPDDRENIVVDKSTNTAESGVNNLHPGNYEFDLNVEERWYAGDLLMQRGTSTRVPFSVIK